MNGLNLSQPNLEQINEFIDSQNGMREKYTVSDNPYSARLQELEKMLERLQKQTVRDLGIERQVKTEIDDCKRILGI